MKKSTIIFISVYFFILLTAFSIRELYVNEPVEPIQYKTGISYTKDWERVDSLESLSQPKSALKLVNQIYKKAKRKNNIAQILKSIIYQIKYDKQLNDDGIERGIKRLNQEIAISKAPVSSFLYSMKAKLLTDYYQTIPPKRLEQHLTSTSDDLSLWSGEQVIDSIITSFQYSLTPKDTLCRSSIQIIKPILDSINPHQQEATLFDFLAERVTDTYKSKKYYFKKYLKQPLFNSVDFFKDAGHFLEISAASEDNILRHQILTILQEKLRFYIDNPNPERFINIELYRLKLMKELSSFSDKELVYYKALQQLLSNNRNVFYANKIKVALAHQALDLSKDYEKGSSYISVNKEGKQRSVALKKEALAYVKSIKIRKADSVDYYNAQNVRLEIERPFAKIETESVLIPDNHSPALLSYKNIQACKIEIYKINRNQYENINYQTLSRNAYQKPKSFTKQLYKTLSVPLIRKQDFQNHTSEFILPKLKKGYYLLVLESKSSFNNVNNKPVFYTYSRLQVSDITVLNRSVGTELNVLVLNRNTGKTISDAVVNVWEHKGYGRSKQKKLFTTILTDKNGEAKIEAEANHRYSVELFYEGDTLFNIQLPWLFKKEYREQRHLYIYTDRNIYRPGQKVHFKGILNSKFNNQLKSISDEKLKVEFKNQNYRLLDSQFLTTDKWGSITGSFTIPENSLGGQMYLSTSYGQLSIRVEAYKRPEFEVEIYPFKGVNTFGKSVNVSGKVMRLSGGKLGKENFAYTVRRYQSWRWSSDYAETVAEGTGVLNADGQFQFEFVPEEVEVSRFSLYQNSFDNPTQMYEIEVQVHNQAGQISSTKRQLMVARQPIDLEINASEYVSVSSKDSLYCNAFNLNQEALKKTIKWSLYKNNSDNKPFKINTYWFKAELNTNSKIWASKLPQYIYKNKQDSNYTLVKSGKILSGKAFPLDYTALKEGDYIIQCELLDGKDLAKKESKHFMLYNPKTSSLIKNEALFLSSSEEAISISDKKAKVLIGSGLSHQKVLLQAFCNDKIVFSKWKILNQEKQGINIPLSSEMRGKLQVRLTTIFKNRIYNKEIDLKLPEKENIIDIQLVTFRDTLLPGKKEQWKLKVKGISAKKVDVLANMYDASLDYFVDYKWNTSFYHYPLFRNYYRAYQFKQKSGFTPYIKQKYYPYQEEPQPHLMQFDYAFSPVMLYGNNTRVRPMAMSKGMVETLEAEVDYKSEDKEHIKAEQKESAFKSSKGSRLPAMQKLKLRENFKETAFFFPNLKANDQGEFVFDFTLPESLIRWKFRALAHTSDMKYGYFEKTFISQKELMVQSNPPRFYREGDEVDFPIEIINLKNQSLKVNVTMQWFDQTSKKNITQDLLKKSSFNNIVLQANESKTLTVHFTVPENAKALRYQLIASTPQHSDGESRIISVLSQKTLVNETEIFMVKAKKKKHIQFESFKEQFQKVKQNVQYKVEISSQPSWYAMMSLPYLTKSDVKNTSFYSQSLLANAVGLELLANQPQLEKALKIFKNQKLSAFEKNEAFKELSSELTPFFNQLKEESEHANQLVQFFKPKNLREGLLEAIDYLASKQMASGAWAWFDGMRENRFVSRQVLVNLAELKALGVRLEQYDNKVIRLRNRLINYLDRKMFEDYTSYQSSKDNKPFNWHLSANEIQYFYARSYFIKEHQPNTEYKEMFTAFESALEQQWAKQTPYIKALIAQYFINVKGENNKVVPLIVRSIQENAIHLENGAISWKTPQRSYYWYQSDVEQEAEILHLFKLLDVQKKWIEGVETHLLQLKRTHLWTSNNQTIKAVTSLLQGSEPLQANMPKLKLKVGKQRIKPEGKEKDSFNYFSKTWNKEEMTEDLSEITVNNGARHLVWGAAYWQYYQDMSLVKSQSSDISIEKEIGFVDASGQWVNIKDNDNKVPFGTTLKVHLIIKNQHSMDFVHLKDNLSAALELKQQNSSYKRQNNLFYYQTYTDEAVHFFLEHLPKGTFIIEYDLFTAYSGVYTNGLARIQSQYAPEYTAHSKGGLIQVIR